MCLSVNMGMIIKTYLKVQLDHQTVIWKLFLYFYLLFSFRYYIYNVWVSLRTIIIRLSVFNIKRTLCNKNNFNFQLKLQIMKTTSNISLTQRSFKRWSGSNSKPIVPAYWRFHTSTSLINNLIRHISRWRRHSLDEINRESKLAFGGLIGSALF